MKYLTDKGGAMALEMLYLCKPRDVLEEQVCVCGGIDVTACAYLRVYVSVFIVCMLLISVCACVYVRVLMSEGGEGSWGVKYLTDTRAGRWRWRCCICANSRRA